MSCNTLLIGYVNTEQTHTIKACTYIRVYVQGVAIRTELRELLSLNLCNFELEEYGFFVHKDDELPHMCCGQACRSCTHSK